MVIFEVSRTIQARPAQVWPILADVVQWPAWLPTVTSVEGLDGTVLAQGARFRLTQPRLQPAVWTVTRTEPAGGFTWQSTSPGVRMVAEHLLHEQSGGSTNVTLRLSISGLLGGFVGRMARHTSERYLAQEADSLKRTVEHAVELALA